MLIEEGPRIVASMMFNDLNQVGVSQELSVDELHKLMGIGQIGGAAIEGGSHAEWESLKERLARLKELSDNFDSRVQQVSSSERVLEQFRQSEWDLVQNVAVDFKRGSFGVRFQTRIADIGRVVLARMDPSVLGVDVSDPFRVFGLMESAGLIAPGEAGHVSDAYSFYLNLRNIVETLELPKPSNAVEDSHPRMFVLTRSNLSPPRVRQV